MTLETIKKELGKFEKESNKKVEINNITTDLQTNADIIDININGEKTIFFVVEKNNYAINLKNGKWSTTFEKLLKLC